MQPGKENATSPQQGKNLCVSLLAAVGNGVGSSSTPFSEYAVFNTTRTFSFKLVKQFIQLGVRQDIVFIASQKT